MSERKVRALADRCLGHVPIEAQTMTPNRRIGQATEVVKTPKQALDAGTPEQLFDRFEIVIAVRVQVGVSKAHRIAGSARRTAVESTGCYDTGRHAVPNQEPGAFERMSQGCVFAERPTWQPTDGLVGFECDGETRARMDPVVRPGVVRSRIQKSIKLCHLAQKGIFETAAPQKPCTERDVLRRIGIDIARDSIDPFSQRRKIARYPKRLNAAIRVRRQNDAIVATPCHQQVGRAVHGDLARTTGMRALGRQSVLNDVKPVGHRLCVGPRHLGCIVAAVVGVDEDFKGSGRQGLAGLIPLDRERREAGTDPLRLVISRDRHDRGGTGRIPQTASTNDRRPIVE